MAKTANISVRSTEWRFLASTQCKRNFHWTDFTFNFLWGIETFWKCYCWNTAVEVWSWFITELQQVVAPKLLSRGLLLMEQISSDSVWCYVVRWILVTGCCWWGRAVFWQSHNFKVVLRGSFVCVPGPGRLNANNEPWEAPGIRKLIRFIIFVFFS